MSKSISSVILIEKFWESIPSAWRRTRKKIRQIALEEFKISEEQFQVLRRIRKGNNSVSALADASLTSRSAVSRAVDSLVKRSFITRTQDPKDRRNIPLVLTNEGRRVMDAIYTEAEDWLSIHFGQMNSNEMDILLQGMEILRKTLAEQ